MTPDGVAIFRSSPTPRRSPFVCPHAGAATFRLAATDDGRIAAPNGSRPRQTGRRLLSTELVRCTVTGRRVSPELAETCPISGRRLLRTELVQCGSCRQRVTPQVVERNQCSARRRLKVVPKADPPMARFLHEHPALDRWRRWRMSETSRVYVLVATGWLKRLLVVVDKETLELRHIATGSRFFVPLGRSRAGTVRLRVAGVGRNRCTKSQTASKSK